jgi:NCAIR mutase (PurE)-related protein
MAFLHDHDRLNRIGLPEAVLCEGKDNESLVHIITELDEHKDSPFLFTRLSMQTHQQLPVHLQKHLDYDPVSATAILHGCYPENSTQVAIVTAGTSDLRVAREAERTLYFMGLQPTVVTDVGVAGIWRLMERLEDLRQAEVMIAVAGMDAALPTVLAGLLHQPIIGVPTSTGYGVAHAGNTAMNAMLSSCAQGILVTNIDNGFGAACAAMRIINTFTREDV